MARKRKKQVKLSLQERVRAAAEALEQKANLTTNTMAPEGIITPGPISRDGWWSYIGVDQLEAEEVGRRQAELPRRRVPTRVRFPGGHGPQGGGNLEEYLWTVEKPYWG